MATSIMDPTEITFDRLADSSWSWTAKRTLDGLPVEITFNTNNPAFGQPVHIAGTWRCS